MDLSELFGSQDFLLDFDPADKWDAIDRLLDRAIKTGKIVAEAGPAIRDAVVLRERSMSTGMERGIAIPHAAIDELETVQAVIGVVTREEGLAFESIDAQPARLVVLLLIPRAQKLLHIRTLAEIARVLGQAPVRAGLAAAADGEEALRVLQAAEGAHPA